MARYIDADKALEFIKETNANYHWLLAQYNAQWVYDFIESQPAADVVPKSEVDQLKKALEAQEAEYSQALHDKAREYNMVVDKICLEHRAEYARLHEAHQEELATAKREGAWEIFEEIDSMIFGTILPDDCAIISIARLAELKKKYTEDHHDL